QLTVAVAAVRQAEDQRAAGLELILYNSPQQRPVVDPRRLQDVDREHQIEAAEIELGERAEVGLDEAMARIGEALAGAGQRRGAVVDADQASLLAQLGAQLEQQRELVAGVDPEAQDPRVGARVDAGQRVGEVEHEARLLRLANPGELAGDAVALADVLVTASG